ncbi:MAG: hypothetical protein AAF414_24000 [Pseudomonadota bacterium]
MELERGAAADPEGALALLDRALAPSPAEAIVTALTRLRLRTKARRETTEDIMAGFALYAEDLAAYPADVAHETLEAWPRRAGGKWWPSWAELEVVLRAKSAFRRAARERIARLAADRTDRADQVDRSDEANAGHR